jgi:hypothetical protein
LVSHAGNPGSNPDGIIKHNFKVIDRNIILFFIRIFYHAHHYNHHEGLKYLPALIARLNEANWTSNTYVASSNTVGRTI